MMFFRPGRRLRALQSTHAEHYGGGSSVVAGEEITVLEFPRKTGKLGVWVKCKRIAGTYVDGWRAGKSAWEDVFLVDPDPRDFEVLPPVWLSCALSLAGRTK